MNIHYSALFWKANENLEEVLNAFNGEIASILGAK
jgi:hypothetical protein